MLGRRFKYILEAGCDEAGRGCLAGPVVAAAVILPEDYKNSIINDSKLLSHSKREMLRLEIERESISWAYSIVDNEEIDEINILNASIMAMHRAVRTLKTKPEFLLIDGNRFHPYDSIPHQCFVKGDSKWMSIAAASIIAKTYRDDIMRDLHNKFPLYDWNKNKGYPTLKHRKALVEFGPSPFHRKSFKLSDPQLQLF